jgi:hypothetical protein
MLQANSIASLHESSQLGKVKTQSMGKRVHTIRGFSEEYHLTKLSSKEYQVKLYILKLI